MTPGWTVALEADAHVGAAEAAAGASAAAARAQRSTAEWGGGGDEDADEYGEVAAVHANEAPCGVEIRKTATANMPHRRSPVEERIPALPRREPRMFLGPGTPDVSF